MTLFCEEAGDVGKLIHNGTMPKGPLERFGRKPVGAWKFRLTGELRVHKKTADQKGWAPRKLGLRGKALARAG